MSKLNMLSISIDDSINNYNHAIVLYECPLCGLELAKSKIGIHSHLRKHVKNGLMTNEYKISLVKSLFKE